MGRDAGLSRWWWIALAAVALVALMGMVPRAWADSATLAAANNGGAIHAQSTNADVEPNDTREKARAIKLGTTYSGGYSSDSDRYDWYKITLSSSGLLNVQLSQTNSYMKLYSAVGTSIYSFSYDGSCRLTSGTYYVRFGGEDFDYEFSSSSRYSFKLVLESAWESFEEAQGGSNNSIARASQVALGKTYRGQIAENDSVDYYRFTLPASGRVSLSITSYFSSNFELLDAGGLDLWSRTLWVSTSGSTHEGGSWTFDLGRGNYYLRVAGYSHSSSWYEMGTFNFKVSFTNAKESFAESQGGSNNYFGSTNAIALGKTYVSQLAMNDAKDIFKFKTSDSGVVRVKASSGLSNTSYLISDAYGDSLASSSGSINATTGRQSFSWTCVCGKGTRYLTIARASDDDTGPVSFSVKELKDIGKAKIGKIKSVTYTGKSLKPTGIKVKLGGKTLKLHRDYTVSFSKNKNVGTAKVTITGAGDYTGTKTATFKIKKAKQKVKVKGDSREVNSRYTLDYWQSVSIDKSYVCHVKKAVGKVTFKKVRVNKRSGCFKVKKNGTVVVKAGTPEGTYKLKIKAKAKGNKNYKPGKTTFTVKIKVKYW